LIGHWAFDEGSGTTAADSSGHDNTGVFVGNPVWTSGRIGNGLQFGDVNDAVEISTSQFDPNAGTIAMWAYAEEFPNLVHYLFGYTSSAQWSDRIQLYVQPYEGDPNAYLELGLGDSHKSASRIQILNTGQWYHIALTWDEGFFRVYVNGEVKASGEYEGLSELGTFADIGNTGSPLPKDRTYSFFGKIDEVSIYSRVLTPTEVLELYD